MVKFWLCGLVKVACGRARLVCVISKKTYDLVKNDK